jgi:hypothetical protein
VNPRVVGSILGVLIGMGLVIYLDKKEVYPRDRATNPATLPASPPAPVRQDEETAVLRNLTKRQAEEIARLQRAKEVDEALYILRSPRSPRDPARPELVRLRALSSRELNNEIETAVGEVESYTEGGVYAPERHLELYKRINNLWDLRGLTPKQNEWLAVSVKELNGLVVRHVEEAIANGDEDEAVRAVTGLGEWAFRLIPDQRRRLIAALEKAAARLR